jgi:hypothetical protein
MAGTAYRRDDANWAAQNTQNSARPATVQARFDTHGWGEMVIALPVMFDCAFIDRPVVSYGYALDGDALVALRYPRACGGVSSWVSDEKGFTIGAHVFLIVDTMSPTPLAGVPPVSPDYDIDHHFVFTGMALKTAEMELFDD